MNDMRLNPYRYIPLIEFIKTIKSTLRKKKNSSIAPCDFAKDSERFVKSWKSQFFIRDFDDDWSLLNKNSYEESKEILHKITDFCRMRGFRPVIVIPPISEALRKQLSDKAIERCVTNYVYEAVGNEVLFLNYIDDKSFKNNSLFTNSYFLNSKGAKLFTKQVLSDINTHQ